MEVSSVHALWDGTMQAILHPVRWTFLALCAMEQLLIGMNLASASDSVSMEQPHRASRQQTCFQIIHLPWALNTVQSNHIIWEFKTQSWTTQKSHHPPPTPETHTRRDTQELHALLTTDGGHSPNCHDGNDSVLVVEKAGIDFCSIFESSHQTASPVLSQQIALKTQHH